MVRVVKREPVCSTVRPEMNDTEAGTSDSVHQGIAERRLLRSEYNAVKALISDQRDDIVSAESDNFNSILSEMERLHQLVQKPREQVADAEALLDITNTLVSSMKAHGDEGVTPSDFVNFLLTDFLQQSVVNETEDARNLMAWKDIGVAVSHLFMICPGFSTMLGPMNTELKQRQTGVRTKRARDTESECPEELQNSGMEERTDTDKNMFMMFDILKKNRRVKFANIVLNKDSFPQTVENIFALSFLVKDGRAEITVDEDGSHIVSPRNAPVATAVSKGDVSFNHFVLRYDFKDWKLMKECCAEEEALMAHRSETAHTDSERGEFETSAGPTTPIRKLSRNRGLVIQEQAAPGHEHGVAPKATGLHRGKQRKSRR